MARSLRKGPILWISAKAKRDPVKTIPKLSSMGKQSFNVQLIDMSVLRRGNKIVIPPKRIGFSAFHPSGAQAPRVGGWKGRNEENRSNRAL